MPGRPVALNAKLRIPQLPARMVPRRRAQSERAISRSNVSATATTAPGSSSFTISRIAGASA
jgi:hypothetical protein